MTSSMTKPFVILGAGGHACVVADLILAAGGMVVGMTTPDKNKGELLYRQIPALGADESIEQVAEFARVFACVRYGKSIVEGDVIPRFFRKTVTTSPR